MNRDVVRRTEASAVPHETAPVHLDGRVVRMKTYLVVVSSLVLLSFSSDPDDVKARARVRSMEKIVKAVFV